MIIRKLICPSSPRGFLIGSGAGSGAGPGSGVDFGGTAFGVDGVSATGNTATDAAIGFTSGEGTNEAGPNFGGLSGASSSAVSSAVAAANAAAEAGGDTSAQQAAAGLSLAGQSPSTAAANAIADAGLAALAAEETQAQIAEAQATPDELSMGVEPFSSSSSSLTVDAFNSLMNETLGENVDSQMSGTPNAATEAMIAGIGSLAPAQIGPPAAQMAQIGPNQTTDLSAMVAEAAAADNAYGVSPTGYNIANQQTAYVSPVQNALTGAYTINGVPVSEQFAQQVIANQQQVVEGLPSPSAGLMGYMGKVPGVLGTLAALTGYDPEAEAAQAYGTMLAMEGAEVDEAGNITAPAGSGTLNYSQALGGVTYSGMPNANYSGPFAGLVNPAPEPQGGASPIVNMVEEEPVVDPCPPGYALVDGVCQPTQQMVGGVTTGVPNTPVPPVFQPVYQPFQPQQINPFVLSPTGAALGRSV